MEEPTQPRDGYPEPRPLVAFGCILVAGLCFASVSAAIKSIGPEVGLAPPIWIRGLLGTILCLGWMRLKGRRLSVRNTPMLTLRCLAGGTAMLCYYWALTPGMGDTDLTTAVMLLKTAPLWVALLSPWVVRERPGARIWFALAVGLVGVGIRYGWSVEGEQAGVLLSLLSGLLAAFAYLALRALSKSDDALTVVTVFSIFLFVAPLPFMGDAFASYGTWSTRIWVLLGGIGVLATLGQLSLTTAYRKGSAAAVTVAGLSEIAMALGFSVLVFDQIPEAVAILGGLIAVAAGFVATSGKPRAAPAAPPSSP
jgi:drug/metabolite transporter (DMT)-like permease